jgi:S-DNA-T family DNA segregation ATPase FtsK/SpoIIIE
MNVLTAASPPGRGLYEGMEVQVAVLGQNAELAAQAAEVKKLATAMTGLRVPQAPEIRTLSDKVRFDELPAELGGRPVVGRASDTLEPFSFDPEGAFLVCGPPQSGRTETVGALAYAVRRWRPDALLFRFGTARSPLNGAAFWEDEATDPEMAAVVATGLLARLTEDPAQPFGVFVENVAEFAGTAADMALIELSKRCTVQGHLLVVEGESSTLGGAANGLTAAARSRQSGFALAPDANAMDYTFFRTAFPRGLSRADFPAGRGLFVATGKTTVVQIAMVPK